MCRSWEHFTVPNSVALHQKSNECALLGPKRRYGCLLGLGYKGRANSLAKTDVLSYGTAVAVWPSTDPK